MKYLGCIETAREAYTARRQCKGISPHSFCPLCMTGRGPSYSTCRTLLGSCLLALHATAVGLRDFLTFVAYTARRQCNGISPHSFCPLCMTARGPSYSTCRTLLGSCLLALHATAVGLRDFLTFVAYTACRQCNGISPHSFCPLCMTARGPSYSTCRTLLGSCLLALHATAVGLRDFLTFVRKLAEVARPPAPADIIMQLSEHQDFQTMPVRGELIQNSRILVEPGKDLFRCRSVYTSKATVKTTDMMGVARALARLVFTTQRERFNKAILSWLDDFSGKAGAMISKKTSWGMLPWSGEIHLSASSSILLSHRMRSWLRTNLEVVQRSLL